MPGWLIVVIVLIVVVFIAILIGTSVAARNRQYQEMIEKNYLELDTVVNDTVKLKVKLWKRHESRNQATIFFQKTYKNTIEVCFCEFFQDLACDDYLSSREQSAVDTSIYSFLDEYSNSYPFCKKVIEWINECSGENQNLPEGFNTYDYVANKISDYMASKYRTIKKKISKNHGFRSLKDFINEYRNTKQKEVLVPGIYVIWNKTKNLYYVGQAYNIYKRITSGHFDVNGNCRNILFYDDYNNGDEFFVSFIKCDRSELNKMEKETIRSYYPNVYNKTKGNI